MLEPRDTSEHGNLNVDGEGGGKAVGIDLHGGKALRLKKDLVSILFRKPDDLVFYGGTVPRTDTHDDALVEGRTIQPALDDFVRLFIGISDMTRHLGKRNARAVERKGLRRFIPRLNYQSTVIDGPLIQSRGRSRLQAPEPEPQGLQGIRKAQCGEIPQAPRPIVR